MATQRQRYWLDAAEEDARRGNSLAAGLFVLIGQPNDAERAAARRAAEEDSHETETRSTS